MEGVWEKMVDVDQLFNAYIAKATLFHDRTALQSNYLPEEILHREQQIEQLSAILAPALKLQRPSNLFIYGKTGTGKTLTTQHFITKLEQFAKSKSIPLKLIYVNCKLKRMADTEYRLVAQLIQAFGRDVPITGLPTQEIYRYFFDLVDAKKQLVILFIDEIDQLVKKTGDEILYNLTRINSELRNAQLALVGISNDLLFTANLDPRVKSSLSEEELLFHPYNALHIQDILRQRAVLAFMPDAVASGVIEKCAAFAAKEHGDARRALELLRVAGEIAEREGSTQVVLAHLDRAEEKIDRDTIVDVVRNQPKQYQLVLAAILAQGTRSLFTGDIYAAYQVLCANANQRSLTQRRISDILGEFDMLGIINAEVISKGRYGRTRKVQLATSDGITDKLREVLRRELDPSL